MFGPIMCLKGVKNQRIFCKLLGMERGIRQDPPRAEMDFPKLYTPEGNHAPDAIYHIIVRKEAQLSRLPLFSIYLVYFGK